MLLAHVFDPAGYCTEPICGIVGNVRSFVSISEIDKLNREEICAQCWAVIKRERLAVFPARSTGA